MKKLLSVCLSVFCLAAVLLVPAFAEEDTFSRETRQYYADLGLQGTTINVYNWGEYISDGGDGSMNVVKEFERLTGCKVNYTTFESNENMYSKLSGGGVSYDVVIPSDYMVERLAAEGLLETLDFGNIPNYEKYIDGAYKGLFYDEKEQYSVPYNVGTTILIYNTKLVKEKPDSWRVLWDAQYKDRVLMFNNPRDAFAIAQSILGQDYNTEDPEDWQRAADLLREQRETVNPKYVMDEIFNLMESGEYAVAAYYAGDYELMVGNNPDLAFAFPKEDVNYFYDAMCVPKGAQNKRGAEAFINFMQEPEVALANAEYIYYASPNTAVVANPEYSLGDSEAVYPHTAPNAQYFRNLDPENLQFMNNLWLEVKGGSDFVWLYRIWGVAAVLFVAVFVWHAVRARKKKKFQNI